MAGFDHEVGADFGLSGVGAGVSADGGCDTCGDTIAEEEVPAPQVFNGATLPDVNVPASVTAGQTFAVSGVVGFDCPVCVIDREIRVAIEASHLDEPLTQNVGKLSGRGQTRQFNVDVPAPTASGQSLSVRIKAQRNPPTRNVWETDNTAGPFQVNVVTAGQRFADRALSTAPWAVGGGAIGAGAAHLTDNPIGAGGAVGAGVGLGTMMVSQNLPRFPTTTVVALAALLGTGAIVLGDVGPDVDIDLDRIRRRVGSPLPV